MINTNQTYSLLDWSEPRQNIENLIQALQKDVSGFSLEFEEFGFDHVLMGKLQRTEFLVRNLKDFSKNLTNKIKIYHRAAFSIFAASDDPLYKEAGSHSDEYMKLLLDNEKHLTSL